MNNLENRKIENNESEPKHNIVKVDFMRHGSTKYLENTMSQEDKSKLNGNFPLDLTLEGENEVKKSIEEIISKIDKNNEIIALWSSPTWRAQGTESIIVKSLKEKGIEIYKDSSISQMRSFDQYNKEHMSEVWSKLAPTGKTSELLYSKDPEFQVKNDKFESQPEVRMRAEQVFNWIRYLSEYVDLKGKKLHIIGVSHFEFLNPIIEDIFNTKIEEGEGINKGENVSIQFDFNPTAKKTSITADFRNKHKENITFDSNQRKFVVE